MNFIEANELKNKNLHLLGKKYKGAMVDELIIRPINEKEYDDFIKTYLRTLSAELSLEPFVNSDLGIDVIFNKDDIKTSNYIFRTELENLSTDDFNINF